MFTLEFNNLKNLNTSLQVGDAVYAHDTITQTGANDPQAGYDSTGVDYFIGILRKIDDNGNNQYVLHIDDSMIASPPTIGTNAFIMFSKYDQSDGDVLGYYADVKLVNDSKEKAELYVISSEVIINSK